MSKAILKLDWCDYKAAKYAVEHWHYSKSLPTPPKTCAIEWNCKEYPSMHGGSSPTIAL